MKKQENNLHVFYFWYLIPLLGSFLVFLVLGLKSLTYYFFFDTADSFMDFFNSVYQTHFDARISGVYPPFPSMVYALLNLLVPPEVDDVMLTVRERAFALRSSPVGAMLLAFHIGLFFLALLYLLRAWEKKQDRHLPLWCMALSGPLLFAIQRGNIVIYAFLFTLAFYLLNDDSRAWVRQISYICLAIAANIKLYPAIFGLFIFTRKRWKDVLATIGYGLCLFVLPAFVFPGGATATILHFCRSLLQFSATGDGGNRFVPYCNFAWKNLCSWGMKFLAKAFGSSVLAWQPVGEKLGLVCLSLMCLWIFVQGREKWMRSFALTALCIFIPGISYRYVLVFLLIPFIDYCSERSEVAFVSISFGLLLTIDMIPWRYPHKPWGISGSFVLDVFLLVGLLVYAFIVACKDFLWSRRQNTLCKEPQRL